MAYSEPIKQDSPVVKVRRIARLAQLILDLRAEYEQKMREDTLVQIKERVAELQLIANEIDVPMPVVEDKNDTPHG